MLRAKFISTVILAVSLSASMANAVPIGKKVEKMLNSPGARELMAEEVESWKNNLETNHLAVRNDVVISGTVVLHGTPSPAQRFNRGKLIRCDARAIGGGRFAAIRNSCDLDHPIYLPLSAPGQDQPTSVAPGIYILGFENSIYPGFFPVVAGTLTAVELQRIAIPAGGAVKVYRDTNSLTEEFKIYFSTYVMGQSLFKLSEYSFGDLYIKTFGTRDGADPLTYKTCEAAKLPLMTTKGARICKAWNMGTFMTMTEMFNFAPNGSFSQWEVGQQGKPYEYTMGRLLVAERTSSAVANFVNVLPGQYVVEVTDARGLVHAQATGSVGAINTADALAMNMGWLPEASKLVMNGNASTIIAPSAVDPTADAAAPAAATLAAADTGDATGEIVSFSETCGAARMWRTDLRAYCTNDNVVGCNRTGAKVCEAMFDTP